MTLRRAVIVIKLAVQKDGCESAVSLRDYAPLERVHRRGGRELGMEGQTSEIAGRATKRPTGKKHVIFN